MASRGRGRRRDTASLRTAAPQQSQTLPVGQWTDHPRVAAAPPVDDGLIAANPCSRVPLPRVEARVVEPLPASAVVALAEAMPPRYAVTVRIAAGAGLREGEALGLTTARVDFLRRRIHIEEQLQGSNGGALALAP
jgi:integrase